MQKQFLTICLICLTTMNYAQTETGVNQSLPSNPPDYPEYGGKIGLGIAIFRGISLPVRYYVSPGTILDFSPYLSTTNVTRNDKSVYYGVFGISAGVSKMGKRYTVAKKEKIRAHGAVLRYYNNLGTYASNDVILGWAMETFKKEKPNQSFIFELGLLGSFPNYKIENKKPDPFAGLHLRCHWIFFID